MDVVYDVIEAIYFFIPIAAVCIVFGIVYFFKDSESLSGEEDYGEKLIEEVKGKLQVNFILVLMVKIIIPFFNYRER
uniref:Dolichol-phosphate mannosyltransferase subunit 3 n=1 Tax=Strongyloides papillosus TaxID=174720 RepID=A0A0N5BME8_STREA